jgi:GT2 family glycosyltransferase
MISIIICSRMAKIKETLQKNIEESIGVPYEIVLIDNSKNDFDIFTAYNKGVSLSKYSILCFMHDDIEFKTLKWGENVIEKFKNDKLGAIGVAGAPYYPILAGPWWSGGVISKNIIQNQHVNPDYITYQAPSNNQLEVVVLDGVWICIRKSLFEKIAFDSEQLKGYHLYDVDICLQINYLGYKIMSVNDILIQHASRGLMNQNWMDNCLAVQKKWSKTLPIQVISLSYSQIIKIEYRALQEFMQVQKANKFSLIKRIKFVLQQVVQYRLPYFKIQFPFLFAYLIFRDFIKKIGLR